jgi:hypothetical protein
MPIPGDNGNPELEKKKQEERIEAYSKNSAKVLTELKFKKPEKTNFGNIK